MRSVRPPDKRGQTWSTFIRNHSGDVWACDFLQLYDILFRPVFAFFFVVHGTREVVHFNVTRHPTDAWAAQQLREATPFGESPRYLVRDNDGKFGSRFAAVAEGTGIEVVKIPLWSKNSNLLNTRGVLTESGTGQRRVSAPSEHLYNAALALNLRGGRDGLGSNSRLHHWNGRSGAVATK